MVNARTVESYGLEGKTVLITGAGRGLGRAMAEAFAAEGAHVAMIARSAEELSTAATAIAAAGGRAAIWVADVTDLAVMRRVVEEVERSLGPIQVLINNAGAIGPIAPLSDADPDAWWRCVEVNLRGPALCTRLVLPRMQARRGGRIINVASNAGVRSFTYFSAYVAAKTALVRLTECVAAEAKPYGVAVFSMEPGTVKSAMSDHSVHSDSGRRWIPWFRRIFDEGLDVPAERGAVRALELASGRADALSGRFLPLREDLARLIEHEAQITELTLYSLRTRTLAAPATSPALATLQAQSEAASPTILMLRATLPATRDVAFGLWSDPSAVERWFLPVTGARWLRRPVVDARPGGELRLDVASPTGRYHLLGRFRSVEPGRRLVMDWSWETESPTLGAGSGTLVTVEFLDARNGSETVIMHEHFAGEAARNAHLAGWARCLDSMQAMLDEHRQA